MHNTSNTVLFRAWGIGPNWFRLLHLYTVVLVSVEADRVQAKAPQGSLTKDGGLKRQLSSNARPTFYSCTAFRQPFPLPEGALNCRRPAADCIVYYRTGGVTVDSSIVYDLHCLAARWTLHAIIDKCGILLYLKSLCSNCG